jgi:threonine/homoserine/homoserine lactone efflux protein
MIDRAHFLIFLSAAVILAISPGPGMIYVLARSLRGGRAIGLASCFGTAAGGLARRLNSSISWQRRQRLVSGGALVGLGGYVAVS